MLYVKSNYISSLVRKDIRKNGHRDLVDLAIAMKVVMEYDPEYGTDLVWDYSKQCYVINNSVDLFNTACQAVANCFSAPISKVKELYYILRPLCIIYDEDNDQDLFLMPSTKKVVNFMEAL